MVVDKIRIDQIHEGKIVVDKLPVYRMLGDTITLVKMSGTKMPARQNSCR
jgi:hypothetical protein